MLAAASIIKVAKAKDRPLTTVFFVCRSEVAISLFVKNFIYMYFPTLDFFVSKFLLSKIGHCSASFYLSKFPSIIEADLLLSNIDDLLSIYNLTKTRFTLDFETFPGKLDFMAFSHFNRLPVLL
jgi:hypothetical protein